MRSNVVAVKIRKNFLLTQRRERMKKKKRPTWRPATIGEKPEGWEVCYTVAIPNLPLVPSKKVMEFVKWMHDLEGFVGIRPEYPHGTLIVFKTENDAKRARNLIRTYPEYDGTVGNNIGEVFVPGEYVHGDGSKSE